MSFIFKCGTSAVMGNFRQKAHAVVDWQQRDLIELVRVNWILILTHHQKSSLGGLSGRIYTITASYLCPWFKRVPVSKSRTKDLLQRKQRAGLSPRKRKTVSRGGRRRTLGGWGVVLAKKAVVHMHKDPSTWGMIDWDTFYAFACNVMMQLPGVGSSSTATLTVGRALSTVGFHRLQKFSRLQSSPVSSITCFIISG